MARGARDDRPSLDRGRLLLAGQALPDPPRRVIPKPLQEPHPPLWCASTSPESHTAVGENGLGLLSFTIGVPPGELATRIALYRDGISRAKPIGKFVNPRADAAASFEW